MNAHTPRRADPAEIIEQVAAMADRMEARVEQADRWLDKLGEAA